MSDVVSSLFEPLLPKDRDLDEWNSDFLAANKDSAAHVQAALDGRQLLKPDTKAQCVKDLLSTLDLEAISVDEALAGLELLGQWGGDSASKSSYVQKADSKFPHASVFQGYLKK